MTVWETLVHLVRNNPLGNVCDFTAHGVLKAMGLDTGGEQHRRLHSTIIRLTACALEITHDRARYFGSLVQSDVKDEITNHYRINISPELVALYGETRWTALNWHQRQDLRGKHLALALHGYYSSHNKPYPIKLATLHNYTGSRNKNLRDFNRQTQKALAELTKVGFLAGYVIEGDLVTVHR